MTARVLMTLELQSQSTTHAVIRVLQDIRRTEENTGVGLKNRALAIAGLITASIWAQKIVRTMP